jgi:hypothetical protein
MLSPSVPSEYNEFLFAIIGEENNKTPLSVLSALTRLEMDPWHEAARLTRLPKDQAINDFSSTLGALPSRRWRTSESKKIAARLVEFLPSQNDHATSLAEKRIGRRVVIALTLAWIIFATAWITFVVRTSNTDHGTDAITRSLQAVSLLRD